MKKGTGAFQKFPGQRALAGADFQEHVRQADSPRFHSTADHFSIDEKVLSETDFMGEVSSHFFITFD